MEASPTNANDAVASAAPVKAGERLISLDLMRGFAVLGILLANVTAFAQPDLAYYWPPAIVGGANEGDALVWLTQFVLIDGKFRGLFTILFGAGMALFMDRIAPFDRAAGLQARRLGWLLIFGLAHFFLLFRGDILFSYACAGLLAMFAVQLKARTQIVVGIIWAAMGGLLRTLAYLPSALIEVNGATGTADTQSVQAIEQFWQQSLMRASLEAQLFSGDSYMAILQYRLFDRSGVLGSYFTMNFYETIPLMMIGMGLYRLGIFRRSDDSPHWQGLAIGGVMLGLAINLSVGLYVYLNGFPPYATQVAFFGVSLFANVPLLVGAVAIMGQWAARPREGWLAERLAQAGRMAFSNYVGTSLVMVLMFEGWAGGLFGTMHRLELLAVVAFGWALMLTFSRLWLRSYRQGPLEYLWRCLTYWRVFPNRV